MKQQFKKDLFEDDPSIDKNELAGVKVKDFKVLKDIFIEDDLKQIRLIDQEYLSLEEPLVQIRRKLQINERRIQSACTMKLYAKVDSNQSEDVQEEMVEISIKYPVIISPLKDKNTIVRSFMIQYIFKLVFNKKSNEQCHKSIFKFLQKIQKLQTFECNSPVSIHPFTPSELKCILSRFIIKIYLLKLVEGVVSLEKLIKIFNDSPEVDLSAIIICKNLLLKKFHDLKTHKTYQFLIEEDQLKIIPQVLSLYDQEISLSSIPFFVEVFKCDMIILNDTRAEQPNFFIPQTKSTLEDDIYLYLSWNGYYHSLFEFEFSQQHLEFCLNEFNLFQTDKKELAETFKKCQMQLKENESDKNNSRKDDKRWQARVKEMEETNKTKPEGVIPSLMCCECERELSDQVPLLKFDVYYFCEACISEMLAKLSKEDKQFTYIGQSQVKRYQLRDGLNELAKEKILQSQKGKKQQGNLINTISAAQAQDLLAMEIVNEKSKQSEKQWEALVKQCLKCGDHSCYQDELQILKEATTNRNIALCISCVLYLSEQIKLTYRNVKIQGKFELSNQEIKAALQECNRKYFDKLKTCCTKCLKIRLYCYIIEQGTKQTPDKLICKQCFMEIFQQKERLSFYEIKEPLKESILDDIFRSDFIDHVCISCDKKGLKTLNLECLTNSNTKYRQIIPQSQKQIGSSQKLINRQSIINISSEQVNNAQQDQASEEDDEEEDYVNKRKSRVCIDCIFLNVGSSKNAYMDYLISYSKLKTNIVYKYNSQVQVLIDNNTRKKLQKLTSTCTMCLKRLKDLHVMNDKNQRICDECFIKYRFVFRDKEGILDGIECNSAYQDLIFSDILATLHDLTQCIACSERIKNLEYEALKLQKSFSNVILCDQCIENILGEKPFIVRQPYQIRSGYFNEMLALQNKKEVDEKIKEYQKMKQKKRPSKDIFKKEFTEENQLVIDDSSLLRLPPNRQQFSSKDYQFKCFNKTCKEIEVSSKDNSEVRFVKMPKCQCLFCFSCFTAFYHRMNQLRIKKAIEILKLKTLKQKTTIEKDDIKNSKQELAWVLEKKRKQELLEDQDENAEIFLYCPGNLCDTKYSEFQIKELASGHNLQIDIEQVNKEEGKKRQQMINEEAKQNFFQTSISCTICRKDNRLLAVMNDDFIAEIRKKRRQEENKNKMFETPEDDFLINSEGFCECSFACKPCLFQLYYLDRCNRCLKKPPSHIYKILFNFQKNMKCPRCQESKFINQDESPLFSRIDINFVCKNCNSLLLME